ncbi:TPA: hypothetical protein N0F65_002653 [Lagenidium giganteum]|uniref:Anaphase-promoting complex subunit 4 WD40 domain-containing protein n=1 Tax=Lagenidium giganteum TaxID=4803 RepID=A0AAV2Z235_9STRA|nr:TPA: hypothetical protein N0F65_002653 [Lagenidium giganteum]
MADMDDHTPEDILVNDQVYDIDFHPTQDVLALGTISGVVQCYKYSEEQNTQALELKLHQDACRALMFSSDGQSLFTASADKSIRSFDTHGNMTWTELRAHEAPVNRIHELSTNVIASGDDQGLIKIWDTRQHRCVAEFNEHVDYISGFAVNPDQTHLIATGGDGRLSAYDLRKMALEGKSDELDDELLSVSVIKNGRKVVCGSQDGVLVVFSWGTWGDMSDRFPGHPESVEALLKVDEDTVLTGSSDGIIRVVQLHPNKLLGLIGDHEDFPIEMLKLSHDQKIIGSVSHTNKVHFWDVGYLFDDDGDDEDVDGAVAMDEEMKDADSDSNDSDVESNGQAGRRVLPTANEKFFSDL